MARNEASASSSEMLRAMVKPSHQSAAAGVVPPPTVGAAASTVLRAISGAGPEVSIIAPAREPHWFMIATSPASQTGLSSLVVKERKSGPM
jgi:hypothetical protein